MNKKLTALLTLALLTTLLTSCATVPSREAAVNKQLTWQQRKAQLTGIKHWQLEGAIAVKTPSDAFNASMNWRQMAKEYVIRLFGPLGAGNFQLRGNDKQVTLQTSDKRQVTADTPEELMDRELGWRLPVSNLFYWIKGMPAPSSPADQQFDSVNHLTRLTQQGWTITYQRYTSAEGIDLPSKLKLENHEIQTKIVVSDWKILH